MTNEPAFAPIRLHSAATGDQDPACPADQEGRAATVAQNRQLIALLAAVAAGDRDAFTDFYRHTSHRVFGLAVRVLRSHAAAEEVTQEVYLQAWSMAARYDESKASPIGWLMMLTHRRAVDRVRTEQNAASRDSVYGHAHLGRAHDTVAEEVGQKLDEQAVLRCLGTLTATQREAVGLAYYTGRTYREVADHLAVPLPTLKSRIRDGLKRLENCLTGKTSDA
ncbi:ECF RNA polymerase sigma factor SigK [Nocardia harenae]|uniref:ECF RNA polymerase sigma factor SigK n=1 Tax=Nocardia harenae TaxID=358707 RepID=UPI00082B76C6|nr:ECF RNA polymerase sigma factor SigK [Nocardia harenae]